MRVRSGNATSSSKYKNKATRIVGVVKIIKGVDRDVLLVLIRSIELLAVVNWIVVGDLATAIWQPRLAAAWSIIVAVYS